MMTEFNITLPSTRRVQGMIRDREEVEVKLLTRDEIKGTVQWMDSQCLCLSVEGKSMVIWLNAIAFIKTQMPHHNAPQG